MPEGYVRRVLTRGGAFAGACAVTGLVLALQAGTFSAGAIVAAFSLAALFAPFGLIDAFVVPAPRSRPARLARIAAAALLLLALTALWQWRAFSAVPADLQTQIVVEAVMRDAAFLGAYLLLEAALHLTPNRRAAA